MKLVGYMIGSYASQRKRVEEYRDIEFDPETNIASFEIVPGRKTCMPINSISKVLLYVYPKVITAIVDIEDPNNIIKFYTMDHEKVAELIIVYRYKVGSKNMLSVLNRKSYMSFSINADLYKIPYMYPSVNANELLYVEFEGGSLNKEREQKQLDSLKLKIKECENQLANLKDGIRICGGEDDEQKD